MSRIVCSLVVYALTMCFKIYANSGSARVRQLHVTDIEPVFCCLNRQSFFDIHTIAGAV